MNEFSLIEKLNILMNIIVSSPLFLFCSMMAIAVLILFIISIKKDKKINKWIFISIWAILALLLIINYSSIFFNLIDNLFDSIFMALYFPNITVYIVILFISNFSFLYSIISKKVDKKNKIINFINVLIIDLFLILIVDITNKNNINIYDQLIIYSNSSLLVLFQLTTALFTSWILISLLVSAHNKLKKYDKKEDIPLPEIIFEDI